MKSIVTTLTIALLLASCSGMSGYIHKSKRFDLKVSFPGGWEVWDKSDDRRDFLQANLDGSPEAHIIVTATPVAPDIEPGEIYPAFMDGGGDANVLNDFGVDESGTIAASNGTGRFIKIRWQGSKNEMRGYRAVFIGKRFLLEIDAAMTAEEFEARESDILKMMHNLSI